LTQVACVPAYWFPRWHSSQATLRCAPDSGKPPGRG
jgi:hypothetical protein